MTTGVRCGSCGTGLRRNAKYCDECGSQTSVGSDPAEYKQVTVLFADVVRSMDIAAALDIERLREVMADLLGRAAAVARRFGGTVEYNGDGIMALFGAPMALEDHALRACVAALAIQDELNEFADRVERSDRVAPRMRVGLNSGRVIAGDIGSAALGYAATGETVGFAQRMEQAAPTGGVLLSESTARLVEHAVTLGESELVRIKGVDEPVSARRLLAIAAPAGRAGRVETTLVGRRWEMAALNAIVDRSLAGRGGVVTVVGPPGIGKSRVAREAAASATSRGVEVFWAFCESHTRDVPFYALSRLLRTATGVADLDDAAARARLRANAPADVDQEDLLLLADLLGVADPDAPPPQIDPDARRRRLTALINTSSLERFEPALYIIEDAHWIDTVSESMLAEFAAVMARTPSTVLITYRPEYAGALSRVRGAQAIALAPLGDSDGTALVEELLGSDASVDALTAVIADRASGNPFFAHEMVRELVQRGVLTGKAGGYVCHADVTDLSVPSTVEAAVASRIDRLSPAAKRTLNAASVLGLRFEPAPLAALGIDPEFDELLTAELIEQVRFTPNAEYNFHHPLIRTVAYESQLRSDRAEWHRRLAAVIEERDPASVEENAALIAEHLESAGDMHEAYGWHMRAAGWSAVRDVNAARISWERAYRIATALPHDDPAQPAMRTAPLTMLCATDFQAPQFQKGRGRFDELRALCQLTGDKVSLAIGMAGMASELNYSGRMREASQLASEQMALLESIGDPTLTIGLTFVPFINWFDAGEIGQLLKWTQVVVDLADGDATKGAGFGLGSPLALALAFRGVAKWWLGRPGWRDDFDDALAIARDSEPTTLALTTGWCYGGVLYGIQRADDAALRACEEALASAQAASGDLAVQFATYELAALLLNRDDPEDRARGFDRMVEACAWLRERIPSLVPISEVWAARETLRRGDHDRAVAVFRKACEAMPLEERPGYSVYSTAILAEALIERAADGDLAEAKAATDRLANLATAESWTVVDVIVLRLRALMARARGDAVAFRDLATRYHAMATSLGYEGHIDWAEAMLTGA